MNNRQKRGIFSWDIVYNLSS